MLWFLNKINELAENGFCVGLEIAIERLTRKE